LQWKKKFETKLSAEDQKNFGKIYPSVLWAPNRAQERIFSLFYEAPYPRIALVTFGNGTGKTDALGEFLCGVVKGTDWVNQVFCNCDYFKSLQAKRDNGTLTVWWVCDADLMKKNGPDYKAIKAHIPDATFFGKDSKGIFHEIHIPTISSEGVAVTVVVSVKTHGQGTESYAGENVDLILCDEPPPEAHWSEIVGRLRSKVGETGARIVIGGTPLSISGYLCDIVEDPLFVGKVVHLKGSTWENCAPEEIPESEVRRLGIPKGEDGLPITRGHLTYESIYDQIAFWNKSSDPMTMKARIDGEFAHTQGRIYKEFDRAIHVIKPYPIPADWPVLFYMDPHDARPDVGAWAVVTPTGNLVFIAESPEIPYEMIIGRSDTIGATCEKWWQKELANGWNVVRNYGDPNKLMDPDPETNKRLWELYKKAKHGKTFNVQVTDDLTYGHEKVRKMLWFDREKHLEEPDEPMYKPKMFFFETCGNCINFMIKYSSALPKDLSKAFKEGVEEKFKDFCDVIRYAAVTYRPFDYWKQFIDGSRKDEWKKVKEHRQPKDTKRTTTAKVFK
jgi:phage terminase large subunit-like protein